MHSKNDTKRKTQMKSSTGWKFMDKAQKNFSFLCKIIKKTPNYLAFHEK